ncbi:MAG: STAS domain-containing protein [Bacillati bacterium ANGP1]|uniref:Anti-sigma factor antagonist n=1 Tax=Candidatus Segetimicrobium genomatis TaxID=2569760 RepID=A0A537K4K5_9BACT|nr:MAG: STAS domain-containing protein [Terrabacteria group bacterium ANGP1]
MELKIGVRNVGETTILDVAGELDLYTVPRLDEGLRTAASAARPLLVVNLAGVAYIDSTALKILTDHQKRVRALHGELAVVAGQPAIAKIFKITGLDKVMYVVATEREALEKVNVDRPAKS